MRSKNLCQSPESFNSLLRSRHTGFQSIPFIVIECILHIAMDSLFF